MPDSFELAAGAAVATIYPDPGGRLGQLAVDGVPHLRGPEDGVAEMGWGYWGSYPLLPWCNRIPGGDFVFEGQAMRVPVSWEDGSALHGLAARTAWEVTARDAVTAALAIDIDEGPFVVRGSQRFVLTETCLDQTMAVRNMGDARVPVGLGIHPWFCVAPVRVPADAVWPGEGPMPTGAPIPVDASIDLRRSRMAPPMDRCYTALTERSVEVGGLTLSWTGPITQVVVYSGDPHFVCVEPVTMANDGFRLAAEGVAGHGVIGLDPGATLEVDYRFTFA